MLIADILKLDPLPSKYDELVELMQLPFWRGDPVRYTREAMEMLRNCIYKELSQYAMLKQPEPGMSLSAFRRVNDMIADRVAKDADRIKALEKLERATWKPKRMRNNKPRRERNLFICGQTSYRCRTTRKI